MKILVLHEIDYLEKVIYEIHEFPELLARAGHEVTFFHFPYDGELPVDCLQQGIPTQ